MELFHRVWSKHRLATVLFLAFICLGLVLQPWSLALVLTVVFGGPLLKQHEIFKTSPIIRWRRRNWIGIALVLSVVLLALAGDNSGRGALILALLPVAWVLVKDRTLLQDSKEIQSGRIDESMALPTTALEEESNAGAENKSSSEAPSEKPREALVGAELLAKVKELGDVGKTDLVQACGYFSIKDDGGYRLNFTSFYEALLEAKGIGSLSSSDEDNDQGDDEEKTVFIKTEPGGHVLFGKLSEEQVDELRICIDNQELSEELREIGDNSYGQLAECDGVINSGDEGEFGNEGTITYSTDQPVLGPEVDDEGTYEDGVYVVVMKLSKCSIEFEFNAEGGFDESEFEEISVPVRFPGEIEHGLYGHPDFNIITGFKFRGDDVEEYEGEVADRGYDTQLTFFAVRDGETTILYSNYNGDEDWQDPAATQEILVSNAITPENGGAESSLTNKDQTSDQLKMRPLGIRNNIGPFSTEIIKSKINNPDSDGDVSIDIDVKLTSSSDKDVEIVLSKLIILTASGLPLIESENEIDVLLNSGSTEEFSLNSSYFKASQIAQFAASETQVLLQLTPCGCQYTELPHLELSTPGGITGISENVSLQQGVQLQGFSAFASTPDEEGGCQLEFKGLIVNESQLLLNKVVVSIRVQEENGREIDSTEWSDKVSPSGTVCLDASIWGIKPKKLDGAKTCASIKIYSSLGSQELSWSVGKKPEPTEADLSQVTVVKRNPEEENDSNLAIADRASTLSPKDISESSCDALDLKIGSACYQTPDEDGDTNYEVEYSIQNQSEQTIELLLSRLFILHKSGLVIATTEDETEDMADNGERISAKTSSWGTSVHELDSDASNAQVMLQVTACSCLFKDLGSIDCPSIGETQALIPEDVGSDQLSIDIISITTDPPDDGECNVSIKALIKNNTNVSFPRAVLSTKLISTSGRDVDDTYTQEEVAPNSQIIIEDSLWGIKENRLNSAKLQFNLKAFAAIGTCTALTQELTPQD